MKGFYSLWTAPSGKKEFRMQDFEILTMALSALAWRKYNGSVKMFADEKSFSFLKEKGLDALFDDGCELLEVDDDIRPGVFWAAGKLYALRALTEPRAMVDLDLIVWKELEPEPGKDDILVIHREEITDEIYPPKDYFQMEESYAYPEGFDWTQQPCNTALLVIPDLDFCQEYTREAIRFMKACRMEQDNLKPMVFAEQRMLAGLAGGRGKRIVSSFPLACDIGDQQAYTHVWGHKNILKFNYPEREKFCLKCLERLRADFWQDYRWLKQMEEFREYL